MPGSLQEAHCHLLQRDQSVLQGGGVFLNPTSPSAPAKLRLLYEVAPLAFIIEAAGGSSSNGVTSVLQQEITSLDIRTPVCLGSKDEVSRAISCLAN
jgi:sedoheptulose-bisphosphatase